ncbi:hypothetical protein ILUMI_24933 [Ignelater luminosus]|uniref:Dipeptidase n=1 Tax=Ignelater luminosus TaxID=2038154 RepID=A0A8K0CAX9_IGNLU|nr:hypothetical protein ILUMI_24933 [Ignelater luminosus]
MRMKIIFVSLCFAILIHLSAGNKTESSVYPAWVALDYKSNPNNILISIYKKRNTTPHIPSPVDMALESFPLIDGHNDLAFLLYSKLKNNITSFNFNVNLKYKPGWEKSHTDIPRLRQGRVGGQFWSAFVFCESQYKDAVAKTLEQIDVIKRLIDKNSEHLQFAATSDGILDAFKNGKIASLIGIEGGHSIDSRLGVLRMYYELGVRYLTLTHSCDVPWATSSTKEDDDLIAVGRKLTTKVGLTEFGKKIILEMNRLGMMVDLSHVSKLVMNDALTTSVAPVIFSHSSAYCLFKHDRNVHDDILRKLKQNRGIIMITFYPGYVGGGEYGDLGIVVAHINHVVDVIGTDNIGLGGDFDGIPKTLIGLEDVSKYPDLLEALFESNPERWTQRNIEKLIGRNLVRVFREVEKVKKRLSFAEPLQDVISKDDFNLVKRNDIWVCRTSYEKKTYDRLIEKMNKTHK